MITLFVVALVLHVILGLIGVIASYATLLTLLKAQVEKKTFLTRSVIAWVGYVASWISGGYYYWFYYGDTVKPVIKAGNYPWAHNVVMEAKEHVFLMLPVLSLVMVLIAWSSTECLNSDAKLKSSVVYLASVITIIGVLVALSGIIISGGAQ